MVRPLTLRPRSPARARGFTLIEMLVVIAIISILASLMLVAIQKAIFKGRVTQCSNNLREIGLAMTMYAQRYNAYPDGTGAAALDALRTKGKPPVLKDADKLFVCPLAGVEPGPKAVTYRGPKTRLVEGRLDHSTPIACDRDENHEADGSLNVLYHQARVENVPADAGQHAAAIQATTE